MSHLESGVVDQNIDTTELRHGLVDNVVALLFLRQIAGKQQALTASSFNPARSLLRIFVPIQIGNCNVCAFTDIRNGHSPTDATVGTVINATFL